MENMGKVGNAFVCQWKKKKIPHIPHFPQDSKIYSFYKAKQQLSIRQKQIVHRKVIGTRGKRGTETHRFPMTFYSFPIGKISVSVSLCFSMGKKNTNFPYKFCKKKRNFVPEIQHN